MRPYDPEADWFAVEADRSALPELQDFYEANPEYWQMAEGRSPRPGDAERYFCAMPPADLPYGSACSWLIREQLSLRIIGEVSALTDLLAPGVFHLSFFIIEAARQGSGLASEIYQCYERWAIGQGARWLRLGVLADNRRAHAYWLRKGYVEVCRRKEHPIGERVHTLIVMVKPTGTHALVEYLAAVPRDRPCN